MAEGTGSTPYVLRMPITTSTAPSKPKLKHEWIVIIPDYEGALEKRMSVRPSHLKDMEPKVEEGFCVLGGRSYHTHLNYFYLIMATYTSLIRASLQEEICPSSPPVVVLLSSPFPEKIIVTPITTHTPPSLTLPTGAILSEPITDPKSPKITGSVLLAVADSREQVIEQLKRDIYFTSGVWDWDKVQIHPFKSAFRKNMEGL